MLKIPKMPIREITSYNSEEMDAINGFLKLLDEHTPISQQMLKELISSDSSHLFFVFDEKENCMGMLTVGIYVSPTGKKAWIEDVVVSENYRGQGVGKKLMEFAIQFAKQEEVSLLTLTSRPFRVAANKLYLKLGFERKETNVYKMTF